MSFQNPIALWGLLGILVPLLVLLLSKRKQDIVEFGSLVFLQVAESQTAKTVYPSQWLKFFLRVLKIFLMVFIVARMVLPSGANRHTIFVEESLWQDPDFYKEDLVGEEVVRFSLDEVDDEEVLYFHSMDVLIEKLNQRSDSLSVYTYNFRKHYVNHDVGVKESTAWIVWPSKKAFSRTYKVDGQEASFLTVTSDEEGIDWQFSDLGTDEARKIKSVKIDIRNAERSANERRNLEAVILAFDDQIPGVLDLSGVGKPSWTISIDTMLSDYEGALLEWTTSLEPLDIQFLGRQHLAMKGALNVENLLGSNLPLQIAAVLIEGGFDLESMDRRVAEAPQKIQESSKVVEAESSSKGDILFFILLLTILAERFLTYISTEV